MGRTKNTHVPYEVAKAPSFSRFFFLLFLLWLSRRYAPFSTRLIAAETRAQLSVSAASCFRPAAVRS